MGDTARSKGFLSKYIDDITAYSNEADASNSFGNYNEFITPIHMKHGDVPNALSHYSNFADGLFMILDDRPVHPTAQSQYSMPMVSTKDQGTLNIVDRKAENREVEKMLASQKANTDAGLLLIGVTLFMAATALAVRSRRKCQPAPVLATIAGYGSDVLLAASDDYTLELKSKGSSYNLGRQKVSRYLMLPWRRTNMRRPCSR